LTTDNARIGVAVGFRFRKQRHMTIMSLTSAPVSGSAISGGNTQTSIAATLGLSTGQNASTVLGQNCATLNRGLSNTFIGFNALVNSTAGNNDTVVGFGAAQNLLGNNNVMLGSSVALNAFAASGNVVVGSYAAPGLGGSGSSNVAIGTQADTLRDASSAVAIGHATGAGTAATALGAGAIATGRGSVALGSAATTNGAGTFSIVGRVRGYYVNADKGAMTQLDTYAVQVEADALKLGNGAALAFCPKYPNDTVVASNCLPAWAASLSNNGSSGFLDLVFRSTDGAVVRFVDDFRPGLLDFTAQHRCVLRASEGAPTVPGMIVVATGEYRSCCSSSNGGRGVTADEAVPIVELATDARDARAFGVLSDANFESRDNDAVSTYRFGNLAFVRAPPELPVHENMRWVVVNAAGEGGILACDAGGAIRNGDLLTTAGSPHEGAAMRQAEPWVAAHTVAKATCDCDFAARDCAVALIGCTYKF
jgi:hypothetical protein